MVEIFGISECLLNFLDSSKLYRSLLVNPETDDFSILFLPENDFKSYSTKLLMPADPTKMWNWELKVCQIPWPNESKKLPKSFWMCHKEKIHQEHPEIGNSYVWKIRIYLHDAKPKIL